METKELQQRSTSGYYISNEIIQDLLCWKPVTTEHKQQATVGLNLRRLA